MTNNAIAGNFLLLSKLLDIHGDDSFKARSYAMASFTIEKLTTPLSELSAEKMFLIKGVGPAIGKKIQEQLSTGHLGILDDYMSKTPAGVIEMLRIKGLGPKKIYSIWRELGIESIGELLYACEENRLLLYKGFGEKTQKNIEEAIRFYLNCSGSYLYSQVEQYALEFTANLESSFPGARFFITGNFNRHIEVIHKLEWVTNLPITQLLSFFTSNNYESAIENHVLWAKGAENILLEFYCVANGEITLTCFEHNCSNAFFEEWKARFGNIPLGLASEEAVFEQVGLPYIPPFLRECPQIIAKASMGNLPDLVTENDIRGIIHCHSNWSDGRNTLEEMAVSAISQGFEYLVVSDHSQSAIYAKGLLPEHIYAQHQLITELNEKYRPFKIFKSIESDILTNGSLDYPDRILETFDLVIASVHSSLQMSREKATGRLLKAISNPFTTIIGHLTGRLLLSRNGLPVDHDLIIEACAHYKVVLELNAHPRRLDMDWRYIDKALQCGVLISINPDSHTLPNRSELKYGVLAAQKGGVTPQGNLSSFNLQEFEQFIEKQKHGR